MCKIKCKMCTLKLIHGSHAKHGNFMGCNASSLRVGVNLVWRSCLFIVKSGFFCPWFCSFCPFFSVCVIGFMEPWEYFFLYVYLLWLSIIQWVSIYVNTENLKVSYTNCCICNCLGCISQFYFYETIEYAFLNSSNS